MRYVGGKGGAGVYQTIINQIPPHRLYVEPFVGGGNIFERKAPAPSSILMDADPAIAALWRQRCTDFAPAVTVLHGDAIEFLSSFPWVGDEFVYLDPPYVHDTRKDAALYRFEMSDEQHAALLAVLARLPVPFALSGYNGKLYDDATRLNGWRRIDFTAQTRRGPATESLWMNYEAPATLADYSHVGGNFRERERIKRKAARWVRRWQQLPQLEREAIRTAMLAGEISSPALALVTSALPEAMVDRPRPLPLQMSMEYSPC